MEQTLSQQAENPEVTQEQISSHEAAMIAKADEAEAKSLDKDSDQFKSEPEEQEQLLAGKYKSAADLEKAYKELEARLGKPEEKAEAEETATNKEEETVPTTEEEAAAVAEDKGFDLTELNKEFAEAGSLSEDTYKMLADKGLGKDAVDAYIAGQQALAEKAVADLHSVAGGTEQFNSMVEWANETLGEAEIDTLNGMISNQSTAKFAVEGLYARYKATQGPNLIEGGSVGGVSSAGFGSQREMVRAMADPRYKTDSAYRNEVATKLAKSRF